MGVTPPPSSSALTAGSARGSTATPAVEAARNRLIAVAAAFVVLFAVITGRLVDLTLLRGQGELDLVQGAPAMSHERADIVDRNGVLLATSLNTASLFANPRRIIDAEAAAAALSGALPELDTSSLVKKLTSNGSFVWLKRGLTPRQKDAVNRLGIPGLAFQIEARRVYPNGRLAAHVIGYAGIDNRGLAGVERYFDDRLARPISGPGGRLELSLDIRVQHALTRELALAVAQFSAQGGAGVVLDVTNGEVVAMVSLPDFDPNRVGEASSDALFNRASLAVYEMGSVFKAFTTAMALDAGTVTLSSGYDATRPIRVARYIIRDFHAKRRWLSVPEIFVYSSNIGAAKMALDVGTSRQRAFLDRAGLLDRAAIELPEVGAPMTPSPWREINTMTVAYGYGIAVSPVQLASGVAALVNGGRMIPATLLRRDAQASGAGQRLVSGATSRAMRGLLRLAVEKGTGGNAAVSGYLVGGKTGTAEKAGRGGYRRRALVSSFVGVFPMSAPRYLVLVLLDEPKGTAATHGYATAGWTAAPVVARVIARVGPLLGLAPDDALPVGAGQGLLVAHGSRGGGRAAF